MTKIPIGITVSLGSFALSLAAVETGLRVWARLEGRRMADQVVAVDPQNRPIVVFCGDSNVYGVYVDAHETLPSAVQRLSVKDDVKGVRAINLGIPGNASWDTLEQVRRGLTVKPVAIVVTCGINNLSVLPADEGLGILESLKITKMIRREIVNYQVRANSATAMRLRLGPDDKPIPGNHIVLEPGKGAIVMTDREGMTQMRTEIGIRDGGKFEPAEPRMRADFMTMIRECQAAKTPLVFATYLAGDDDFFSGITRLMREICQEIPGSANSHGLSIADCAKVLEPAISHDQGIPFDKIPLYAKQNGRSKLLVLDGHPTPLGYELEARVVAAVLKNAGVMPNYKDEGLFAPMTSSGEVTPDVRQSPVEFTEFHVTAAPHDRVILIVGNPGFSTWRGTMLPIDTVTSRRLGVKHGLEEFRRTADATGNVKFTIPADFLRDMPRRVSVLALVERGGSYGSVRRFLSPPVVVNIPS